MNVSCSIDTSFFLLALIVPKLVGKIDGWVAQSLRTFIAYAKFK